MKKRLEEVLILAILLTAFFKVYMASVLKEASFYKKLEAGKVKCLLCPHHCIIDPGKSGICRVRKNIGGKLYALTYAHPVAVAIDPIEKKPLFHYLPGTPILSLAAVGCNMRCLGCQNWRIAMAHPNEVESIFLPPEGVVKVALQKKVPSVAFTYTENSVWYEYMYDIARLCKETCITEVMHYGNFVATFESRLHTISITNGYLEKEPLKEILPYLDAANVDVKYFDEEKYEKYTLGDLKTILENIKIMKEAGVWVELTYLVVPTVNDDTEEIKAFCEWVKKLDSAIPVHFTRFFPAYKLRYLPVTPYKTLQKCYRIAKKVGLEYVYIGNIPGVPEEDTYCPRCGKKLIDRDGYWIKDVHLKFKLIRGENDRKVLKAYCPYCGYQIKGVWR